MKLFLISLDYHTWDYLVIADTPDEALDLLIDWKRIENGFHIDEYDVQVSEYPIAKSVICEVEMSMINGEIGK